MKSLFDYIRSGLGEFLVSYMQDHKDEVISLVIEILKKIFAVDDDAKVKILAAIGDDHE